MILTAQFLWSLDGWIILAGLLCAIATASLGNFLVLRKMSLLGDAISHAVLPGLAIAFLVSQSRNSWVMFLGAIAAGVLTALLSEWIHNAGKVDEGAALGVVFTSLFALGLVLIVRAADSVDLDADCVLYGAIELSPLDTVEIFGAHIPQAVVVLACVATINVLFVAVCFKELLITTFDPLLATTSGFRSRMMHYLLMILVAVTAVASFQTVGSVLVVAMMIVPPAAAYLLTERLSTMIWLSCLLGGLAAVTGHLAAVTVPSWFGLGSTSTAGMIAVMAGLFFIGCWLLSPKQGVMISLIRRYTLAWRILCDDILALLYRVEERQLSISPNISKLSDLLLAWRLAVWLACRRLSRHGLLDRSDDRYLLSDSGRQRAIPLVRSHRLWEEYLVSQLGLPTDRIHDKAELYEHYTSSQLRQDLSAETNAPEQDPHGSPIPPEN